MKKHRILLSLLLILIIALNAHAQTATVTLYYSGAQAVGCCDVCGTDYMCIGSSGCPCCQASQQTKTFVDPVPAGNTVTGVTITYYAADCSALSVPSSLNGTLICSAVNTVGNNTCACSSCNPVWCSNTFPCGLPNYVYGGVNTLYADPSPFGTEICTQRVTIQLTYAPGGPSGPATPGAITGPTTVCPGQVVTYSIAAVTGATSYTWTVPAGSTINSGQGSTSISVTIGSGGGQVCVTATNVCGTSSPSCLTIGMGSAPATPGPITGSATFCPTQTYTYSITAVPGATTYNWTVPAGATINSGQGTTSVSVTFGSNAGQICVTATGACGTSAASCLTVSLGAPPSPPASITGGSSFCSGATATFSCSTVTGATSYNWTVPAGTTITSGQGTTSITVTLGSTGGQVCVTATTICGTSTPTCITISIQASPPAPGSINGPAAVCDGSVQIYSIAAVSGATGYTWSVPAGSTITAGQNTTSITVSMGTPGGDICVFAISTCGNGPSTCLNVVVNPVPDVTNSVTSFSLCTGETTNIVPAGSVAGTSFDWTASNTSGTVGGFSSSGNGNIADLLTNTQNGPGVVTYTVTPSAAGCTGTPVNFTVTVNPIPQIQFNSLPDVCLGGSAVNLNQASPTGGTYTGNGVVNNAFNPQAAGIGTHTLTYTYTDPLTGCINSATQTITVNTDIQISVSPQTSFVCQGSPTVLTASGANTYTWSPSLGLSSVSGSSVTATPLSSTVYTVTGVNSAGCSGSATAMVNIHPKYGVSFTADPMNGCAPLEVSFNFPGGQNWTDSTWQWNFGDPASVDNTSDIMNPIHTFIEDNIYTVSLTLLNIHGCPESGSLQISANIKPQADFRYLPESISMDDPTVIFEDLSTDAQIWSWNFGDPASGPYDYATGPVTSHIYSDSGTYWVTLIAESSQGCADTVAKPVYIHPMFVVYFPNAFTPNGDGLNETFLPYMQGIDPANYKLMIFDRWGMKVFESGDPSEVWNGVIMGTDKVGKQDVYTWILFITDSMGIEYKKTGRVTLMD